MMTKISGILPSNSRITTIDIANERPLRPGAPSFGQPYAAVSNPRDQFQKVTVRDDELSLYGADGKMAQVGATPADAKVQAEVKAIDELTNKFNGKITDYEEVAAATGADEDAEAQQSLDVRV